MSKVMLAQYNFTTKSCFTWYSVSVISYVFSVLLFRHYTEIDWKHFCDVNGLFLLTKGMWMWGNYSPPNYHISRYPLFIQWRRKKHVLYIKSDQIRGKEIFSCYECLRFGLFILTYSQKSLKPIQIFKTLQSSYIHCK